MANDNKSWDVDDIDFSEIEFEDLDLDDLDFSVDGELSSISDERPDPSKDDLASVADERPRTPARQNRPVRKVDRKKYEPNDDDDDDRPVRRTPRQGGGKQGGGKQGSKAPFIIILCLIVALAIGAILFWLLRDKEPETTPAGSSSSNSQQTESGEETGTTAAWSMNTEEKVMDLVNSYYAARTLGDVESLREILDERITVNEDKAKAEAKVVDSYQNINCYTTPGRNDGEFVAYVSFEMKFKNINTPAPGLSPAYIVKDDKGNLRLLTWEYIVANDESLKEYMSEKGSCDAIRELGASVETNFQNAKAQDPTLAEFLDSMKKTQSASEGTNPSEQPSDSTAQSEQSGENTSSEAPSSAQGGDDDGEESFRDVDTMMYAQANVRARVKPNTSDDTDFTLVTKGTRVQVTGEGNKWYRVCLKDGSTAYIFKQYLADEKPAED
jgi:Uncharacterized protein conserved in bacteria